MLLSAFVQVLVLAFAPAFVGPRIGTVGGSFVGLAMWAESIRVAIVAPTGSPLAARAQDPMEARYADDAIVARAFDSTVTWKELEPLLIARRALSKEGRDSLTHLAKTRTLEVLAKEQGIEVSDKTIDERCAQIEAQMLQSGEKDGLEGAMRRAHLSRGEFRHFLRLGVVQEILTRRALGKKEDESVSADQQELYLAETMKERKLELLSPPWDDGVAARASGITVSAREFLNYLRRSLSPETLREDCYQVLLLKRARARMPDLAADKLARAVDEELTRRKADVANDPKYKGIPWEKLLAAQGYLPESMKDDPGINATALSRLWVERAYDDATLKRVYADEREHFDAQFGAAIDVRMIVLRGAALPRDGEERTFKDADAKLGEFIKRIHSIEDFERVAKDNSEDAQTRENGGELGWVTVHNTRQPQAVREVVERELAQNPRLAASSAGTMAGPVRLPNGCALLWLGARRSVPSWEQMSYFVQRELRQRFLDEALPRTKLVEVFKES